MDDAKKISDLHPLVRAYEDAMFEILGNRTDRRRFHKLDEYVATPEVQDRMKKAFQGAVDAALGTMPDLIKAEVASAAAESFRRSLLDKIGHR